MRFLPTLSVTLGTATGVLAHSHITYFVINGDSYQGYDPRSTNPSVLASWKTSVEDDGWIGVGSYELPDIVCHVNASSALGYAPIAAGDKVDLQWMGWPQGHHGPVLTYLARCGDDSQSCEATNKTDLLFFEISRAGLLDPDSKSTDYEEANGVWATDLLISRNNSWLVEIPATIKPGFYVLRHEIIALHYATNPGLGPQHYPQCFNLEITGGGSAVPEGVLGSELYQADEPGLVYDIYQDDLPPYTIPGPPLMTGVASMVNQTSSKVVDNVSAIPAVTPAPA